MVEPPQRVVNSFNDPVAITVKDGKQRIGVMRSKIVVKFKSKFFERLNVRRQKIAAVGIQGIEIANQNSG